MRNYTNVRNSKKFFRDLKKIRLYDKIISVFLVSHQYLYKTQEKQ